MHQSLKKRQDPRLKIAATNSKEALDIVIQDLTVSVKKIKSIDTFEGKMVAKKVINLFSAQTQESQTFWLDLILKEGLYKENWANAVIAVSNSMSKK